MGTIREKKRYKDIRYLIFKAGKISTGTFAKFSNLKTWHLILPGRGIFACGRDVQNSLYHEEIIVLPFQATMKDPVCKDCLYREFVRVNKDAKLNL